MLFCGLASFQLDSNANAIKSIYESLYSDIKEKATDKWETDHQMVVYEINIQSQAFSDLTRKYESKYLQILNAAIKKWGTDKRHNNDVMKIDNWSMSKIHADWQMVLYEYNNQTLAANSY
tara:strand:+ start:7373 stop:7732 length:360 start_codon:yes stop_codon:yes gene_type:complete